MSRAKRRSPCLICIRSTTRNHVCHTTFEARLVILVPRRLYTSAKLGRLKFIAATTQVHRAGTSRFRAALASAPRSFPDTLQRPPHQTSIEADRGSQSFIARCVYSAISTTNKFGCQIGTISKTQGWTPPCTHRRKFGSSLD